MSCKVCLIVTIQAMETQHNLSSFVELYICVFDFSHLIK